MDRFDDPRSRKRNNADDPRDTRIREHDDEVKNGKPQKLKRIQEGEGRNHGEWQAQPAVGPSPDGTEGGAF